MDQFKTRILNTNQLSFYSGKPVLIFYVKVSSIVVVQLLKTLDGFDFHFELSFPMKESLIDALDDAIQKVIKHKDFNRRARVMMMLDDYYLTMNRLSLSQSQLKNIEQSLEIEIDNLDEYEYATSFGPSEVKHSETLLVYMIKKNNLSAIEGVFKKNRLFIRKLVSRYHSFQSLFNHGHFKIEPSKLSVLIDISATRARLYIVLNNTLKVYRRMPLKLIESTKNSAKQFDSILSDMKSFVESSMESYLVKYPNQSMDAIYITSDALDVSKSLKKAAIGRVPVKVVPINSEPLNELKIEDPSSFQYIYGYFLMSVDRDKFNIIPFMKRFEKIGIRSILGVAGAVLLYLITINGFTYFQLSKSYSSYTKNQTSERLQQANKKREMVEQRNRIKKQKVIIDYADLTSESLVAQIPLDDFLYNVTSISTPDISFAVLRVRRNKVFISGTSSSLNGNYSFYMFLQQLEAFPYLGRIKYNLGISGGIDLSSFSIDVDWIPIK